MRLPRPPTAAPPDRTTNVNVPSTLLEDQPRKGLRAGRDRHRDVDRRARWADGRPRTGTSAQRPDATSNGQNHPGAAPFKPARAADAVPTPAGQGLVVPVPRLMPPRSSHALWWTVQRWAGASLDPHKTLDQIVAAVVELLGFHVAVMNLVSGDGDREVLSGASPAEVREPHQAEPMKLAADAGRRPSHREFAVRAPRRRRPPGRAGPSRRSTHSHRKPHPRSTVDWG